MSSKFRTLKAHLEKITVARQAVVAWSGGVDSTVLAVSAKQVLGDNVRIIHADTEFVSRLDAERVEVLSEELDLAYERIEVGLLEDASIRVNAQDRCYRCKKKMLAAIAKVAGQDVVILDGTNADDDRERPGRKALLEAGAVSPLEQAGLTKKSVRAVARKLGLSNAEHWSNSCLATRVLGRGLDKVALGRIEQIEAFLSELGLEGVRARLDDLKVIVEIPRGSETFLEQNHERIRDYVSWNGLVLAGYGWRDPR